MSLNTLPQIKIQIPDKLKFLLDKKARYKVAYGGRGAGKSETAARCLLILSLQKKIRILCTRELQNSITDSVHKLLSDLISDLGLNNYFTITKTSIRNVYGSEFLFKGLKNNINEIKSLQGVNIVWVEEAERVSENSWQVLIPTIRENDSEIWILFNPDDPKSATYTRFILNPNPESIVVKINWNDNHWFPEVLRKEMEYDKKVNSEKYDWIWEGNPRVINDSQIFKGKWIVEDFKTPEDLTTLKEQRFFYGLDWGFSPDPLAALRCFIIGNTLYIDQELYRIGVELKDIGSNIIEKLPEIKKWPCYGDSARPDIISMLRQEGFNIMPVVKTSHDKKNYIEAGIDYLKNFDKIVIHPSCTSLVEEMKLYCYKTDSNTGEVLPIIIDKYNHLIDCLRYSLNSYIIPKQQIKVYSF